MKEPVRRPVLIMLLILCVFTLSAYGCGKKAPPKPPDQTANTKNVKA